MVIEQSKQSVIRQTAPRQPEVAFVLTGGAALGASQVGMLRALLEHDIMPDLIVGTSIGSWNGLWFAMHPTLASIDALERLWKSVSFFELFGKNVVNVAMNLAVRRPYLVSDEVLRHILQRVAGEHDLQALTFADVTIPFKVTATNIMQGTSAVFDSGPIAPAIFASSAMPGIFPPVIIDGQQYVDGGLLDNGGVGVAVEAGAKKIYILSVTDGGSTDEPSSSLTELLSRSFHLIASGHVHNAIRRYAGQAEFIVIEDREGSKGNTLDFKLTPERIASGYLAAKRTLHQHEMLLAARGKAHESRDEIARWLQQPPAQSVLHSLAWLDITLHRKFAQHETCAK